jgi:DNA-binding LacI/PurR family transcriptional regulator
MDHDDATPSQRQRDVIPAFHRRVTIRDVAAGAGVSNNTVSRVINDRPDVSPATRARVQRVVEELGYRPNSMARSLLSRRSRTIGHVVTDYTNPMYAQQLRAVQTLMMSAGYSVIAFDTLEDPEIEQQALRILEEKLVDGVLLTPTSGPTDMLHSISRRMPLVLMNREVDGLAVDAVLNDNALGAKLAIDHLLEIGHRRIAYITSNREVSTVRDRLVGYRRALEAADLSTEALVARTEASFEAAALATTELMGQERPTAIFAYNDNMAVGVLSALLSLGVRVPDDVALVGFDDIRFARYLSVPLTTIAQPSAEIFQAGGELLLQRIDGMSQASRRLVFEPKLIVRASTGGPRASSPPGGQLAVGKQPIHQLG